MNNNPFVPARYTFTIRQGATFNPAVTFYTDEAQTETLDLTGFTARMQIRTSPDNTVLITLVSIGQTPQIVLSGSSGVATITVSSTTTAAWAAKDYVYDFYLYSAGGTAIVELAGLFKVQQTVTTLT